jgi:hypothetical protein
MKVYGIASYTGTLEKISRKEASDPTAEHDDAEAPLRLGRMQLASHGGRPVFSAPASRTLTEKSISL